jgi:isopentenyl-diphosphate Delta-isomerase
MTTKKKEHIDLALKSQADMMFHDSRFDYEPLLSAHPGDNLKPFDFAGKRMNVPVWISSMTGGSEVSATINHNLAKACNEFGLGMGLGSCRTFLETGKYFEQFDMRHIIGDEYPLYANLGICQVEKAVLENRIDQITGMIDTLKADGLIIHINPIQEWLQPEGDRLTLPPLETIKAFLSGTNIKVIVKEVGQGFGPESIRELLRLPVEAIELAAFGGTNFAMVELERSDPIRRVLLEPLSRVGNDAGNIIDEINDFTVSHGDEVKCRSVIVSGGIRNFLDGYYFINKCRIKSVYGQASSLLRYAGEDYENLRQFIRLQIEGLKLANAYLKIRKNQGH